MSEQQKIKRISAKRLIDRTVQYYLESGDFNGLPLDKFFGAQNKNIEGIKEFLKPLIEGQRITIRCDEVDTNPFIKRTADLPPEREVARLNEWKGGILIAYPTRKEMAASIGRIFWMRFPYSRK
jgi:hypothetical protein